MPRPRGSSRRLEHQGTYSTLNSFLAPEVFKSKYYDTKVDIFSIGVLFYFFVFARMPFGNEYNEVLT
jgi:serine/threonine protein kinase